MEKGQKREGSRCMKALSLVWYKVLPPKFGGQQGIALFNKALSTHFPLVCLCTTDNNPVTDPGYAVLPLLAPGKKQFLSTETFKIISETIARESITHIILEHPYHGLAAARAAKRHGCKLILHAHNIEASRFRDIGKWWWPVLYAYERWVFKRAELCLFKTTEDRDKALKAYGIDPSNCMIASYGIDIPVMPDRKEAGKMVRERHGLSGNEKILLFAATLDYAPNARAVERIYEEIAPALHHSHPEFKIIVCGRNKFPEFSYLKHLSHPSVIYAGEQDDILPYFAAADACINPVDIGGGVQTKNIFALACHDNLVCFDDMIEAETKALCPEKIFTVKTQDWHDFIRQCVRSTKLKQLTPDGFFRHYEWNRITEIVATRFRAL